MGELVLKRRDRFGNQGRSLLLVIMDGVGLGRTEMGNAVVRAYTPVLDRLVRTCPSQVLKAHGTAVGLPSDKDMGNSEVGHNALGAGRIFDQGAKLVNKAIETGSLFEGPVWRELISRVKERGSSLHFIGLLSDGNVHSHIDQLIALLEEAAREQVKRVRVHILLDGRDVPETSSPIYVKRLEEVLAGINSKGDFDYRIASGGGRMITTMDRYEADWSIVERGWKTHVHGEGRKFASALEAIETLRKETGANDQFLPPFVIAGEDGKPVGPIRDGDSVIFFNFRGDRAIEISRAFEEDDFPYFDREPRPEVLYAGMMQYDGDKKIPKRFLVSPPVIEKTLGEYMAHTGLTQLACAETQKFGHVTYFWNGNRTGKFSEELETYVEVPSDQVPFEERPWMKAAQVVDVVLEETRKRNYDFLRINFANGDMVGHTGDFAAAVTAVSAVDLSLARLLPWVEEKKAILLVTADHGNADQMFQLDPKTGAYVLDPKTGAPAPLTSHTLNPVRFLLYDPLGGEKDYRMREDIPVPGLANVAATVLDLMGWAPPEDFEPSLLA